MFSVAVPLPLLASKPAPVGEGECAVEHGNTGHQFTGSLVGIGIINNNRVAVCGAERKVDALVGRLRTGHGERRRIIDGVHRQ